jgi:hypothetical protein
MHAPVSSRAIWRTGQTEKALIGFEQLLANALKPVVAELTMVNGGLVVSYICNRQEASLADLIDSSCELALKPGAVRYGKSSEVDFDWGEWPMVMIGLEFVHRTVHAHFRLVFGRSTVGVEVLGLIFAEPLAGHEEDLSRFAAALDDARLPGKG